LTKDKKKLQLWTKNDYVKQNPSEVFFDICLLLKRLAKKEKEKVVVLFFFSYVNIVLFLYKNLKKEYTISTFLPASFYPLAILAFYQKKKKK
jgi:hypothetical protein